MYKIVHLAAECFPIAKTGGLGDVVGALPKYLNKAGLSTCVLLPQYNQKWVQQNTKVNVWKGNLSSSHFNFNYYINHCVDADLGFEVYLVDIPDLLFRENIYGYQDDHLRFLFFQQAALDWIKNWNDKPEVLHCHDHHTGLIPFMIKHCPAYSLLAHVRTVFTIHNGLYTGAFAWYNSRFFPEFSFQSKGSLDWDDTINPLACAIKCCDWLTTVSGGYLDELRFQPNPLQSLYNQHWQKSKGIVNGIDADVWNPKTDKNLTVKLAKSILKFKQKSKQEILKDTSLNPDLPLIVFIGRLVNEKGGELLPQAIGRYLSRVGNVNFYVLGSGSSDIENQLQRVRELFTQSVATYIGYNEALAHKLYAGADFLIMPSIIEPCGLNQLYAMRYATVPMVRSVGGLKDTVVDIGDTNGYGIRFTNANVEDILYSVNRAVDLYANAKLLEEIRKRLVALNFSWEKAVKEYIEIYQY